MRVCRDNHSYRLVNRHFSDPEIWYARGRHLSNRTCEDQIEQAQGVHRRRPSAGGGPGRRRLTFICRPAQMLPQGATHTTSW